MSRPLEYSKNNHLSSSEDSQDTSFHNILSEPSCESLLTVLDDKNREISTLKKQLQNQKEQLSYYLNKELSPKKIAQLSKSCSPETSQQNMVLNLAMANFNRQMGIKSNVMALYERMCYIDERITSLLDDQEFILRKIVNKLCDLVKHSNANLEFKVHFSNFIKDPFYIELFSKLLNATVHLRRKLDTFRICCNRLMIVEDERNTIVEQIYTLPADERMNCNYLVSVQTEKIQIENELQQIIKDQRKDQERIKELSVIEEKLSNLQFQLNSMMFENDDSYRISQMLQQVSSEARMLLYLTKQQRMKYENKLARIKETNLDLERVLVFLRLALEKKQFSPPELMKYKISTKEDLEIYECIKKEIDSSKTKFKCKMFDEFQTKIREIELLQNKLCQAMLEKNEVKIANEQLRRSLSDMKFNQEMELTALKEERDMYKKQVEELESIREAYAQLLRKQPTGTLMENSYLEQISERDEQIYDLEKRNRDLIMELADMKNSLNKQKREIDLHAKIIQDQQQFKSDAIDSEDKNLKYVYKNTNNEFHSSFRDLGDLQEYHDTMSRYSIELYQQEIYVQEKMINWVEDAGDYSSQRCNIQAPSFISRRLCPKYENSFQENNDKREGKKSVTCIKVRSCRKASDVMESAHASIEESNFQRNNTRCNPATFTETRKPSMYGIKKNYTTLEGEKVEMDEYELMKDCSEESIPHVCHSGKLFKEINAFQQRFPVINDNVEY